MSAGRRSGHANFGHASGERLGEPNHIRANEARPAERVYCIHAGGTEPKLHPWRYSLGTGRHAGRTTLGDALVIRSGPPIIPLHVRLSQETVAVWTKVIFTPQGDVATVLFQRTQARGGRDTMRRPKEEQEGRARRKECGYDTWRRTSGGVGRRSKEYGWDQ